MELRLRVIVRGIISHSRNVLWAIDLDLHFTLVLIISEKWLADNFGRVVSRPFETRFVKREREIVIAKQYR